MIQNIETKNTDSVKHRFKLAQAVNWLLNLFKGLSTSADKQALVSDGNGSLAFEEVITTEGGQTIGGDLTVSGQLTLDGDSFFAQEFYEGFAPLDEKKWRFFGNAGGLSLQIQNDAETIATTALKVERTATTVDSIDLRGASNMSNGNEIIHTGGGQTISGNHTITGTTTLASDLKIGTGVNDYGWSDYLSPISTAKVAGTNPPSWSAYRDGIYAYAFSPTKTEEVWVSFHINHDFKLGTSIYPHVHWSPNTTSTGTVRWGIEYTIAKGHQQSNFGATTTLYVEQTISSADQYSHEIAEVATGISSTELEVDAVVLMRVFRDGAHANDTFPDDAFGLFVDLHVQVDRTSTLNKSPNFYS